MILTSVTTSYGELEVTTTDSKVHLKYGDMSVFIKFEDVPDFISELQKAFFVGIRKREASKQP
jgi:hypothetical protein